VDSISFYLPDGDNAWFRLLAGFRIETYRYDPVILSEALRQNGFDCFVAGHEYTPAQWLASGPKTDRIVSMIAQFTGLPISYFGGLCLGHAITPYYLSISLDAEPTLTHHRANGSTTHYTSPESLVPLVSEILYNTQQIDSIKEEIDAFANKSMIPVRFKYNAIAIDGISYTYRLTSDMHKGEIKGILGDFVTRGDVASVASALIKEGKRLIGTLRLQKILH
jgi:hypothetical protein